GRPQTRKRWGRDRLDVGRFGARIRFRLVEWGVGRCRGPFATGTFPFQTISPVAKGPRHRCSNSLQHLHFGKLQRSVGCLTVSDGEQYSSISSFVCGGSAGSVLQVVAWTKRERLREPVRRQ